METHFGQLKNKLANFVLVNTRTQSILQRTLFSPAFNPYFSGVQKIINYPPTLKYFTCPSNFFHLEFKSLSFFFQVISPDDVSFRLPNSQNFNDSIIEEAREWTPDHSVCVTLTNTSGILFLTFMTMIVVSLISSSIITARRCWVKRKRFEQKRMKNVHLEKINPIKSAPMPPKKLLEQQQQQIQKSSKK